MIPAVLQVGKWLFGESLPSHDKLLFGVGEVEAGSALEQSAATYDEVDLARIFHSPHTPCQVGARRQDESLKNGDLPNI